MADEVLTARKVVVPFQAPLPDAGPQKWRALIAAWLGETFDSMDATMFFVVMYPALAELLHTNDATAIGWHGAIILSAFTVGWGLGSILFGWLSDHFGRARMMAFTIVLYALASGCCAISTSWWDFAIYRFFVGLGIGGEASIGSVILSEFWHDKSKQLWAVSVMQTSFPVGVMLTGLFNLTLGWRWLFVIGVVPALVAFYIRLSMKEPKEFEEMKRRRQQLKSLGKKNQNLIPMDKDFLESPFKTVFNKKYRRVTILATMMIASATVGYWGSVTWMPAWINQLTGEVAVVERSSATIWLSVGSLIGVFIPALLIPRFGFVRVLQFGLLGSLISVFSMFAFVHRYDPVTINAHAFIIGLVVSLPWVAMCTFLPAVYPTNLLGTGAGIAWAVGRLITGVVGLFAGQLIVMFNGSYGMAAAVFSLAYIVGWIAALKTREPVPNDFVRNANVIALPRGEMN